MYDFKMSDLKMFDLRVSDLGSKSWATTNNKRQTTNGKRKQALNLLFPAKFQINEKTVRLLFTFCAFNKHSKLLFSVRQSKTRKGGCFHSFVY